MEGLPVTHVRLIWAYNNDERGTPPTISNQVGIGHLTCPMPATHIKTMDSGKDSGYEDKQHNRHTEREQAKPPKWGFVPIARGL